MATNRTHLDQIQDVQPSVQGCEDCLWTGDTWVHLREYLVCGRVGCCDSSASLSRRNALPVAFQAALSPTGVVRTLQVVGS